MKLKFAFLLFLCSDMGFSQQRPQTLAAFKQAFLNQQVIINDVPSSEGGCLEWETAEQNGEMYSAKEGPDNHLPLQYRGQQGTVVAVQLAKSLLKSLLQDTQVGAKNAFGETVTEGDVSDPYLEVIVKFGDGQLGIIREFPTGLSSKLELATARMTSQRELDGALPSLIGRKIYAAAYSDLYKPTSTLEELDSVNNDTDKLPPWDIPILQPLTITKAKYLPDINAVILKVKLPSGSEAIVYTTLDDAAQDDDSIISRVTTGFLTSIPRNITPKQLDAIRKKSILKGMTKHVVMYVFGFPEKTNDWGNGGTQLVYSGGKVMVYLDSRGKVEDWQALE